VLLVAACSPAPAPVAAVPTAEPEAARPREPVPDLPKPVIPAEVYAGDGDTCEAVMDRYEESLVMGKKQAVLPDEKGLGTVLNNGSYLTRCNLPTTTRAEICAAIRSGKAEGVSVRLTPGDRTVGTCIANEVRGMAFASDPRMMVTRTTFAEQ